MPGHSLKIKSAIRTRPLHIAILALICISLSWTGAMAQQNEGGDPMTTIKVVTKRVLLDVVVRDRRGNVVTNLKQSDFTIFEDGVEQPVRSFDSVLEHQMPEPGKAIVHSTADLAKIGPAPVTLLVLDELNTSFEDMAYAR